CFPIDTRATEKERLMKRFTNGLFFKSITMLAIAANTLYLGWAANTNVSNSWRRLRSEPVQQPGVEFDIAFTAWFGVELFIKMIADRVQFFVGEER
ncbi:TCEA2, partial [Symbiodinium necroappetens]